MKFCTDCGAVNEDSAKFCSGCGKPLVKSPQENFSEETVYEKDSGEMSVAEKKVIEGITRNLRRERKCYVIYSIFEAVCLGIVIIYETVIALILMISANGNERCYTAGETVIIISYFIMVSVIAAIYILPVFIANLISLKKIKLYLNTVNTDIEIARKRASSPGMIVFGVLFNYVALIFIILNFIYVRRNRKIIDSISGKQKI